MGFKYTHSLARPISEQPLLPASRTRQDHRKPTKKGFDDEQKTALGGAGVLKSGRPRFLLDSKVSRRSTERFFFPCPLSLGPSLSVVPGRAEASRGDPRVPFSHPPRIDQGNEL